MHRLSLVAALGLLIALLAAEPARAQNWYELNGHLGGLRYDIEDSDTDVQLGARMMLQYRNGFAWGGNFDWIGVDQISTGPDDDADLNLYLYSLGLEYMFPTASQLKFLVSGGVGAATFKATDLGPGGDEDLSETELLVPVGVGLKWYNRPSNPTWALRGDLRDNIIFVNADDGNEVFFGDDDTQNNFEFSGGISFIF
ncbi:MAG: outer membrane beta-barrel protein [Gemmatimonadota bacterium]